MQKKLAHTLASDVYRELYENIIPFWTHKVIDSKNGGFIGRMNNDLQVEENAPKGLINNTRLLWTFSALYRFDPQDIFLELAKRASDYLTEYFKDVELGGLFWLVNSDGSLLDDKKKIYGQAFYLYALAKYYQAAQNKDVFNKAIELFYLIEQKSYDPQHGGYLETFNRDWTEADDLRLSEIDMNEKKSMNTHLHLMEAYTNLYRVWPEKQLEQKLKEILNLFYQKIIDRKNYRFKLFFDGQWNSKSERISFGHDIEGSWLLIEAAEDLGDKETLKKIKPLALGMAESVYNNGRDLDGSIFNEGGPAGIIDSDKHWWPQAEAVVGFLNAWQHTNDERFLLAANDCWQFIDKYIIDHERGEWFWKVDKNGVVDGGEPKVSEWKSAYHNTRACLEILNRLSQL